MRLVVTTAVALLLGWSNFHFQEPAKPQLSSDESKVFNHQSSLIKLSLSSKANEAKICNSSQKRLIGYRIGCVEKKTDHLEIVRKEEMVEENLPGDGCVTWWADHKPVIEECSAGRLAIIEAAFVDGSYWRIPLQP